MYIHTDWSKDNYILYKYMSWVCFSRLSTETPVRVISDLSGVATISVDDLATAVVSVAESALSSAVPVASEATPSQLRPSFPHVACVPVALAFCLPWRPFFRSSLVASPAASAVAVASPEPVAVASPEPVAVASPESAPVAVASPAPVASLESDSLQLRSTAPVDTAKDPEGVKEPAPSVAPAQVKTTQASSQEPQKTQ